MANANDITEQVKLLMNIPTVGDQAQYTQEVNQFLADADLFNAFARRAPRNGRGGGGGSGGSSADAEAAQALSLAASSAINDAFDSLGLSAEQAFLSRTSGELGAVLNYKLEQEKNKVLKRDPQSERGQVLQLAQDQLAFEEGQFVQQNPDAVPYTQVAADADRVKDLATADSFMDVLKKGAATGLAGIPGLAGIGASAVGFEDAGQALGGLAANIRGRAPTDIQSSAGSQQLADIQQRVGLPDDDPLKLTLGQAAAEMATLAVTDGDVFNDLLANTGGALAGGGAVRAGVTGAARAGGALTGRVTGRGGAAASTSGTAAERAATANANLFNPAAQSVGTRLAQGSTNAAPAIGVGLGSGVDETLTTPQARILAATAAVSSGLAGGLGVIGAGTAETALSQAGRLPGLNRIPGLGGQAAQTTDDLAQLGTGQIARNAAGRTVGTAVGEGAQEFVEGGGESLGQAGADGTLTGEDFRQAGITGALQAPLGAVIGGPAGTIGSVAGDRAQNTQNAAAQRFRDDSDAALETQRQTAQQVVTDARTNASDVRRADAEAEQASIEAIREGNAQAAAQEQQVFQERETAVAERQQTLREPFVDDGQDVSTLPLAERRARAQSQAEGVPRDIVSFTTGTGRTPEGLDALLTADPAEAELELRAMYRNQGLDPQKEDAFVDRVAAIDFDPLNVPQGADAIAQAAADSQNDPAAIQRGTQEAIQEEANRVNQERDAEIAQTQDQLAAEQVAQEQALDAAQTQRRNNAGELLNRAFSRTLAERQAAQDNFTTSAVDRARLPIEETLLAAETDGTPRQDVNRFYDTVVNPSTTSEQRSDAFSLLALDSLSGIDSVRDPEALAEDFGAYMSTRTTANVSPQQMVQQVRNYLQNYAPDAVFESNSLRTALLNDPDRKAVLKGIQGAYPKSIAKYIKESDNQLSITPAGRKEAAKQVRAASDEAIADLDASDTSQLGFADSIREAKARLESLPEGEIDGLQADQFAADLDQVQALISSTTTAKALKKKRSDAAKKAAATRRANRENPPEEFQSNDISDIDVDPEPEANSEAVSQAAAEVSRLLNTGATTSFGRDAEPTFDAANSFTANESGGVTPSSDFNQVIDSAIANVATWKGQGKATANRLIGRIDKLRENASLTPKQAGSLGNAVTRLRGINAKKQSPAADGDQSATQAVDSYGDKAGTELEGLESEVLVDGTLRRFTGLRSAQDAARAYVESTGREYVPIQTYAPVDEARAQRIADAYEQMEHNPSDPEVAASYRAMIDETYGQYQAMLEAGVVVEFNPTSTDPYGNPRNAILDVVENNHLYVFSTKEGYGDAANVAVSDNPMLEVSPYTFNGQPALANDVFRAVHDYYGHIQHGLGFRSRGEDNAWRSHATMYSAAARPAATAETRGQNSWVNFGPFAEQNSTASGTDTRFADQKIGLLPDWVMEDAELDFTADTPVRRTSVPDAEGFASPSEIDLNLARSSTRTFSQFAQELKRKGFEEYVNALSEGGYPGSLLTHEWRARQALPTRPGKATRSIEESQEIVRNLRQQQGKAAPIFATDTNPNPRTRRAISNTSVPAARSPAPQGLLPGESASEQLGLFTPSDVEGAVQRLTQSWKAKPMLLVVESNQDLPDAVRPTDGSTVFGITDGDTVYLVSDQFTSESQIADALNEEVFHKGLMRSLGGNYDPQLSRIFNKRGGVDGLLKLARKYKAPNSFFDNYRDVISDAQSGNREAQRELTDEVMAQISQATNLASGIKADLKTMLSKIKAYLRKFFPKQWFDTVSEGDILQTIRDANTAGRNDLTDYSGPVRIRARRHRPGDYSAIDADGNQIIKNYYDPLPREVTNSVQDAREVGERYGRGLIDNFRANKLGEVIFKSTAWEGLMKRVANAKFALQKVEFETNRFTEGDVQTTFDEINSLDLPPQAKEILAAANNVTLKRDLLSVDSAVSRMISRADYLAKVELKVNENGETLAEVMARMTDAKAVLQSLLGLTPEVASAYASRYMNALHAQERNDIAFLKSTELFDSAAQRERDQIFKDINNGTVGPEGVARVRELVEEHGSPELRAEFKGAGMTDAEAAQILRDMTEDPAHKAAYELVAQRTQETIQATNEIRRQTGSFSNSLQNAINAYGWKNYVPLRGKGVDPDAEAGDAFVAHFADNVFSSTFRPFQGRESLVENVLESVYKAALSSVEQNAGQEFVDTILTHVAASEGSGTFSTRMADDSFGGQLLTGTIEAMDMNSGKFKAAMASKDNHKLVRYDPANNGNDIQRALVITLANDRAADAVLGAKSQTAENIDAAMRSATVNGIGIHDVTSAVASLKTWRNLPFIPFDALRNMLTLGYVAATEEGFPGFQKYIRAYTQPGHNYGKQIYDYARLYQAGKFDEIAQRVEQLGEGSIFAEMDEFTRLGGTTNQLAAIRDIVPGSLASLDRVPGGAGTETLKKMDDFFSYINVAADSLSRVAYFRSLKAAGVSPKQAAARAKNTANFERRGTWSGPMSGLFEFFRATGVGATALINSTLTGKYGRETAAATFGAGASLYMLASMFAGVDDEGEDKMAEVNGKLFNRNFVFQYGDSPRDRIQFGLGFGPIAAAASAGIHAARMSLGHQSLGQALDNSASAMKDQLTVLPTAGISPISDPSGFLFNSAVPSILKPWYEVANNMSSLGIPVRSDYRGSDSGDLNASFAGRFNSEAELYDDVTEALQNSGFADINPDDLRHVLRSYGGTVTSLIESVYENVRAVTSDEEFAYNKKAGFYPLKQFMGSEFSQTPENFYNHYNRVQTLDTLIKNERKSGDDEAADTIEDSDFYQDSIGAFDRAKKRMREANDRNREIFERDATSTAEKREVARIRDEERLDIFREYLDAVRE